MGREKVVLSKDQNASMGACFGGLLMYFNMSGNRHAMGLIRNLMMCAFQDFTAEGSEHPEGGVGKTWVIADYDGVKVYGCAAPVVQGSRHYVASVVLEYGGDEPEILMMEFAMGESVAIDIIEKWHSKNRALVSDIAHEYKQDQNSCSTG